MNEGTFDSSFFAANRERLRHLFTGTAPIVLSGNGLIQHAADEPYPFCQNSSFWYLTGIDEPGIVLVMDKGKEYLIAPVRSAERGHFDGELDVADMSRRSGIGTVLPEKEGWKLLDSRLKRVQHVATLAPPPAYVEALGMYTNPARATLVRRLKEINPQVELLDLRAHLAHMRMIKQPLELAAIQHAVDITIDTIKEVTRPAHWAKYAFEYEIEADITRGFRRRGAEGHAFTPIVASGERGCTLHYIRNNHALATGEAVVMDIGARAEHYAADITRTVPIGAPTRRFGQVFDAVAQAQDFAFSLLKPGVLLGDCEEQVVAFVGEKLRELGLIKSISKAAVRELFPHAAFHHLGLDTHDMGDYGHPLEPGVVLAMEPGIYIPAEGVGVRIEDNVLITPNGAQNLSSRLPRVIH